LPNDFFSNFQKNSLKDTITAPQFYQSYKISSYQLPDKALSQVIIYNSTLPSNTKDFKLVISLVIDEEKLKNEIRKVGLTQKGFIFIVNGNGDVISKYSSIPMPGNLEKTLPGSHIHSNEGIIKLSNNQYIVTRIKSDFCDWYYMALIPYEEITSKTSPIKTFTFTLFAILLILSLCLTLLSTNKLYSPIKNLLKTFTFPEETEPVRDEFSFIKNNINHIILENQDLQIKLLDSIPVLQENLIMDILHNNIQKQDLINKINQYNIRLPHKYFVVMVFYFKDDRKPSMIEDIFRKHYLNYYIISDNSYVISILNLNDPRRIEDIVKDFEGHPISLAQGGAYSDYTEISRSYSEAKYAIQFRKMNSSFEYIEHSDLYKINPVKFSYSSDFERVFSNCIETRNYDTAMKQVRTITSEYITENTPLYYIRQIVNNLYSFLCKKCSQFDLDLKSFFEELSEYSYEMEQLHSVEGYREFICRLYKQFLDFIQSDFRTKDVELFNNIKKYIEQNMNNNLSLELVADEFHFPYHYLSKAFKDMTGECFIDYVTRIRIDRAKELLKLTNLKVEEIAYQIGYSNVLTFIRNFNKYEGISPGKYKKKIGLNINENG